MGARRTGDEKDAGVYWLQLMFAPSPPCSFWVILFFIVLVVVMYLWRPTMNNQRYAYSALEGGDDEEEFGVC